MPTLKVGKGPMQGPIPTVSIYSDTEGWPNITGKSNPGDETDPNRIIMLCIMDGMDGADGGAPADPRIETWPEDFTRALRAIVDRDPQGMTFFGATAPSGTIQIAYNGFTTEEDDALNMVADALRAAGFEVEVSK